MKNKWKEVAARELCRIRGIDPDARVCYAPYDGNGPAIAIYSPAWKRALMEIEAHGQLEEAIKFALD
jgi:hypothetical protein